MSKRTLALIVFLTLLTAFFVYLAVSQNQPTKTPVTKVAPTKKPIPAYTTLQLSPENLVLSSNSGSLSILINTGSGAKTNAVTAVQLEMQYDPKMLSNVSITPGTFIPSATALLNSIDQQTGRITYALAIPPSGSGATGKGTVATVRFTSLVPRGGSTKVTILPTTLVTAQGVTESVFLNAIDATISSNTGSTVPVSVAPTVMQGNGKNNPNASEKNMKNKNPQGPKN